MKCNPSTQVGFSLVEVLVALSLLLLFIVGPMQILARSFYSTSYASESVQAWFLAQEGLELAQKGRDDLVLDNFKDQISSPTTNNRPNPISDFLTTYSLCFNATGCGLTIGNGATAPITAPVDCSTVSNCDLYLTPSTDTDRSSYQHVAAGNTPTLFNRVITMQRFPAGGTVREIRVTSTVTWRTGSLISNQQSTVTSYLFNVYDTP